MKAIIKTKAGTERIDTEDLIDSKGFLYTALVNYFNDYINNASDELKEMYFGSFEELYGNSYYEWKGAIIDMYNALCEYIEENKKIFITSKDFYQMDFEGILQ